MYLLLIQPNTFILGDLCTRVLHSLALICTCSHLELQRMSIFLVFSFVTVPYLCLLFISYFLIPMASPFKFYSFGWRGCVCVSHSVMSNSATPWTTVGQAPLALEFSRQEYWSGLPFPPPGDLSNPGTKPGSPALQVDSYRLSHQRITFSNFLERCVGDT